MGSLGGRLKRLEVVASKESEAASQEMLRCLSDGELENYISALDRLIDEQESTEDDIAILGRAQKLYGEALVNQREGAAPRQIHRNIYR